MLKKLVIFLTMMLFLLVSTAAMAKVGTGKVTAESGDVNLSLFGRLKNYPMWTHNVDFNPDDTSYDYLLEENGLIDSDGVTVRNELRLGFKGEGRHWSFDTRLEGDFSFDKGNTDRGHRANDFDHLGMTGEDFGIEKLEFRYDFSYLGIPATLEVGWNTKFLDIKTGGIVYGDDHPYIGFTGEVGNIGYEILSMFIRDNPGDTVFGTDYYEEEATDSDEKDWRAYSLKLQIPIMPQYPAQELTFSPFYSYSDNEARQAYVHYIGAEVYGKFGNIVPIVPKAEFAWATGDKDKLYRGEGYDTKDGDISAYAGYASVQANVSPAIKPYLGGYLISGDEDAHDDDLDGFNSITNISRYTGTFGFENSFVGRGCPVLRTPLYGNAPSRMGSSFGDYNDSGYGGIGNGDTAVNPGLIAPGLGIKGDYQKISYKVEGRYFAYEDEGALEDLEGTPDNIDDEMGYEGDLRVTYNLSNHFSLGNLISVFEPGDGIEDIRGDDYDETAYMNTIKLIWNY